MIKLSVTAILLLILLAACSTNPGGAVTANPQVIKIGAILPLTGDAASYGIDVKNAVNLAVDEINTAGGINGKQFEILFEDGKCAPKDAATAAQKLINVDKVFVILGGMCSGETLGAAPIAEAAKVVMFSPGSGSPAITNAGEYIFRDFPSDITSGSKIAMFANQQYARVALMAELTDYAQGLKDVFKKNYKGSIIADENFSPDESDLRAQITKIKATSPEALYFIPQTPQKAKIFLKQKQELGLNNLPLLTSEVAPTEEILKSQAEEIEGAVYATPAFDAEEPDAKAFLQKLAQKYGKIDQALPPVYSATTYDAVYILKEALVQCSDADCVKQFLYNVKNRKGTAGMLSIDENGDAVFEYELKQIKNGKAMKME